MASPLLPAALLSLAACAGSSTADETGAPEGPCSLLETDRAAPTEVGSLGGLLAEVRAAFHPSLEDVRVDLESMDSDEDFFVANLDLSTAAEDGPDRDYVVRYGQRVFEQPPPLAATGAILVHELQHIVDYVAMDTGELADFAIWYASGDISEYERETDEVVLEAGCGAGLKAYREWLYEQVDAETEAQKRIDYYTPDEIDAWMAAHGG